MHHRLAGALVVDCCHRVSALISFDRHGIVAGVHVFDTMLCAHKMRIAPHAAELWLISGHDDGCTEPYEEDLGNYRRLRSLVPGRNVRLYLASEYWPCRQIHLPE